MQNGYLKIIGTVLKWKAAVLIGSVVLLVLFAALAMKNGFSMMPDMESTQMTGYVLRSDNGTKSGMKYEKS